MSYNVDLVASNSKRIPWNKGKLTGAKADKLLQCREWPLSAIS